jgi:glycosyltransferase involved in cell wall biosynthesis
VIGHSLLVELGRDHRIQAHDFDRMYRIDPEPGDILVGHAHPLPYTVFRRSVRQKGWARRILLEPFNADWNQVGFIDDVIDDCDLFLAITGRYWFSHMSGPAARWKPKMVHVDLAVNRAHFPKVRHTVAPKGSRKFLYVGNDHPGKNLPYLDAIAGAWRGGTIEWAGRGRPLANVRSLGFVDFSSETGRRLISEYDFLITVGNADANPTTVLEAMSWGLVPICTPTSGYVDEPAIVNVPGDDVDGVRAVLDRLQQMEEDEILKRRRWAEERLATHYRWERFIGQIRAAMNSNASPVLHPRSAVPTMQSRLPVGAIAKLVARNVLYGLEERFPALGLHGRVVTRARAWVRR